MRLRMWWRQFKRARFLSSERRMCQGAHSVSVASSIVSCRDCFIRYSARRLVTMASLVDIGPISTGGGQCVLFALKAGNLPMQTISLFRELIDIALNSRTLHFQSASLDCQTSHLHIYD